MDLLRAVDTYQGRREALSLLFESRRMDLSFTQPRHSPTRSGSALRLLSVRIRVNQEPPFPFVLQRSLYTRKYFTYLATNVPRVGVRHGTPFGKSVGHWLVHTR